MHLATNHAASHSNEWGEESVLRDQSVVKRSVPRRETSRRLLGPLLELECHCWKSPFTVCKIMDVKNCS